MVDQIQVSGLRTSKRSFWLSRERHFTAPATVT